MDLLDRLKRECETKCNHEKNAAAGLRSELIKIKNELETTKQDGIDTMKQIETRLTDIDREREGALMHIEGIIFFLPIQMFFTIKYLRYFILLHFPVFSLFSELRNKLRGAEEREADLKRELNDVHRKLKDSEHTGDSSKKEMSELRRTLSEMAVEKEKTNSNMEQLKEDLNRKEADIMVLKKDLNKTQTKVKELDRIKGI